MTQRQAYVLAVIATVVIFLMDISVLIPEALSLRNYVKVDAYMSTYNYTDSQHEIQWSAMYTYTYDGEEYSAVQSSLPHIVKSQQKPTTVYVNSLDPSQLLNLKDFVLMLVIAMMMPICFVMALRKLYLT